MLDENILSGMNFIAADDILEIVDVSLFSKRSSGFHFECFSSVKYSLKTCRVLDLYENVSTRCNDIFEPDVISFS